MSEHQSREGEEPAVSTDNERRDEDEGEFSGDDNQEEEEDDAYLNNHDLIGIEGIIRAQKNEIEKKKVSSYLYSLPIA